MGSPNHQFGTGTEYKSGDRGTGAWAVSPGPAAVPEVPATPGSEVVKETFEGTLWTQISFDSGTWIVTTDFAHAGTKSYTNPDIGDNQSASFTIQNTAVQPQLSFWLRTDTEAGFDKFRVFIDSVEVYSESGFNDWHRVAVPTGGGFSVEFRYSKDFSASSAADACWVDDVVFGSLDIPGTPAIPARPLIYAPLQLDNDGGVKVHVQNAAGGGGTEFLEDSAHASGAAGTLIFGVRKDSPGGAVDTDGDYAPLLVNEFGQLRVNIGGQTVVLDAATLAALETVSVDNFPAVQPISDNGSSVTVDGTVLVGNFPAVQPIRESPNVTTWVSAKTAAPAANSVQADTGQLAAGDYDFIINLACADTIAVGKGLVIEHRNAANSATLFNLGAATAGDSKQFVFRRYAIATNERIRVIAGTAAGTASSMYVSAIGRRLT